MWGGSSDPNSLSSQASYHPGTRVVVDTRAAKRRAGAPALPAPRGLTYQRVQAQARSRGYWPFRLCFELGQRDKKGSGGETRVAFTIGTRGKVSAARLLDSKLGSAASAACLVREVLKLEFTPAPANKLRVVASIRIYPGDAELPVIPDPTVVASLPRGEFDPEAMRARVAAKQVELDCLLRRGAPRRPSALGTTRTFGDLGVGRQRAPRQRSGESLPERGRDTLCADLALVRDFSERQRQALQLRRAAALEPERGARKNGPG